MKMATNGENSVEETEMADCEGENIVTMMDVLKEQQDFEDDANAVLGGSDEKECTYSQGYIKRQAIYACVTCCPESKDDPSKRAGFCLACSLACHESHDLIELYTKRNFRCDCGNPKFKTPCQFTPNKANLNEENIYNQNFVGLYCSCNQPYDPELIDDEMIQCIICEDWWHASHLDAVVPAHDQYSEMICKLCMMKNNFLHDYTDLAVNDSGDVDVLKVNGDDGINVEQLNGETMNQKLMNVNAVAHSHSNSFPLESSSPVGDELENESGSKLTNGLESEEAMETSTTEVQDEASSAKPNNEGLDNEANIEEQNTTVQIPKSENIVEEVKTDAPMDTLETDKVANSEDKKEEGTDVDPDSFNSLDVATTNKEETHKTEQDNISAEEKTGVDGTADSVVKENVSEESSMGNAEECTAANEEDKSENFKNDYLETPNAKAESSDDTDKSEITKTKESKVTENKEQEDDGTNKDADAVNSENAESPCVKVVETPNEEPTDTNKCNETSHDKVIDETSIETANDEELCDETSHDEGMDETSIETGSEEVLADKEIENEGSQLHSKEVGNAIESDVTKEKGQISEVPETSPEKKRKMSTEDATKDIPAKKPKRDEKCVRPTGVQKAFKGATFWPSHFRQKLCTCSECISMYKDLSVLFLTDIDDTVFAYETLGKERTAGKPNQYEKGIEALCSLGRIQQIDALTEYNKMRDKLITFLQSFKERKEIVTENDIKGFFAGMKAKKRMDGVYFCG